MTAPIEFRQYFRKMTMADVIAGLQGVKLAVGPLVNGRAPVEMFLLEGLQYRYQQKVFVNGAKTTEWSEWITVPLVKEGDDEEPTLAASQPSAIAQHPDAD